MSRDCTQPRKAMACYICGEDGHARRNFNPNPNPDPDPDPNPNPTRNLTLTLALALTLVPTRHTSRNCPQQESSRRKVARGGVPDRVCYGFQRGTCTRGEQCKFSHATT